LLRVTRRAGTAPAAIAVRVPTAAVVRRVDPALCIGLVVATLAFAVGYLAAPTLAGVPELFAATVFFPGAETFALADAVVRDPDNFAFAAVEAELFCTTELFPGIVLAAPGALLIPLDCAGAPTVIAHTITKAGQKSLTGVRLEFRAISGTSPKV
jgi:hypothetical protein